MMTEEGAIAAHYTKRASMLALISRAHGLTVVFHQNDITLADNLLNTPEIIWISQQIHRHNGACFVRYRQFQLIEIVIQGIQINVHKLDLQAILIQRIVSGTPRYGWHDNFIATLQFQRRILGVKQRRDHQ